MTINCRAVKINLPGWITVEREVEIPLEMDKVLFKVRSGSLPGSGDLLNIKMINEDGTWRSIQLRYTVPMEYLIGSCTDFLPFPVEPHLLQKNNWVIARTSRGVKYKCNQVEVLHFKLSDQVCTSRYATNWREKWNKRIVAVSFAASDTASEFYDFKMGE